MKKRPKVLLLIEKSRQYGRGLLKGIMKYASLHGPWIIEQKAPFYDPTEKTAWVDPTKWDVDGIIMRDNKFVNKVIRHDKPVIFANRYKHFVPQSFCILSDDKLIGKMGSEHFLEKGFKNFAFLGIKGSDWAQDRQESFVEVIRKNGYDVNVYKFPEKKDILWSEEQAVVIRWLESLPKPVGLMACNDDRGVAVINAAIMSGIKIPEDVAVLGCDNDEFVCDIVNPSLSSIALNTEDAGYKAAHTLDKLMSGQKLAYCHIVVHPTYVVPRKSSDIFAINDRQVVEAISFIYEHSSEPLQIEDVASEVGISNRSLNEKFKKTFNCSVSVYVKKIRTELIAKLLTDTNMTISQIAYKLGFSNPNHIAQYFRDCKGINPSQYRQQYQGN